MSTIAILLILITVLSYLSIWVSIRRNQLHNSTNRSLAQNRKLAKTLFIVRILSLITWLPAGISMKLLKGFKFTSLANHACLTVRQFLSEPNSVQLQNGRIQEVVETLFCRCYSRELIRDAIPVSVSQEISLTYFKSVDWGRKGPHLNSQKTTWQSKKRPILIWNWGGNCNFTITWV